MKQIIAIGGGGFGREIKDLKIEKYIVDQCKTEKLSIEIKFPTKMLLWKSWLGKNNNPNIRPQNIEEIASFRLIFLLKKP